MKVYCLCTPSHRVFLDEWFLPSLVDNYEVIVQECEQKGCTASYMAEGWMKIMYEKVELIIRGIKENENRIFLHSDVDIQFFGATHGAITEAIGNRDMAILQDQCEGSVCAGFFAARGNDRILALWEGIKDLLLKQDRFNDQDLLNDTLLNPEEWSRVRRACNFGNGLLYYLIYSLFSLRIPALMRIHERPNRYGVTWNFLPSEFFSPGMSLNREWRPGMKLRVPRHVLMHHGNWTVGVQHKIEQLNLVRETVRRRMGA